VTPRQSPDTADVIAVFMGHQHTVQIFGVKTERRETLDGFRQAESTVNQQARVGAFDYRAVAGAAATEQRETQPVSPCAAFLPSRCAGADR
jgi:hypothetical protein